MPLQVHIQRNIRQRSAVFYLVSMFSFHLCEHRTKAHKTDFDYSAVHSQSFLITSKCRVCFQSSRCALNADIQPVSLRKFMLFTDFTRLFKQNQPNTET